MSNPEKRFLEEFDSKFNEFRDFNKIKSKIDFDQFLETERHLNIPFIKGFASGFATLLIIVLALFIFKDDQDNSKINYISFTTYNQVLTSYDEETAEEVLLNFVERDPVFSTDSDVKYISNYYIVIYFNTFNSSTWSEYVNDNTINNDNILKYLKLDSLSKYIILDEVNGKIFIKFDAVSKVIVSKYMPEIFSLIETNGVSKVEFSIQLDPKVGDSNE